MFLCVLGYPGVSWGKKTGPPITHLQLFTREDTLKKCCMVIDETVHVAVGLQLLEMSSITTPNQTILNVCTRYSFQRAFFRKIWRIYRSSIMK